MTMPAYDLMDFNQQSLISSSKCRCLVYCALCAFLMGLFLGLFLALVCFKSSQQLPLLESPNGGVTFVETNTNNSNPIVKRGIYWGDLVESTLPQGFTKRQHRTWGKYMSKAVAIKLEAGCGRMQNRLVVFQDGRKGCVRYRQNTDQIQGELFSFYLAQVLQLQNLAPSAVSIVDLKSATWRNLYEDIASAQWQSNKPVVVTQYIPDLGVSEIPDLFKTNERHLNKYDVANVTDASKLQELAQWSDLIIFDYLTANLDRIVNNLYNFQWNANIMDAPAHNLARKSDLLVFLDNESGLLHGYRLLKKYEVYHRLLLENLCVFRKTTADIVRRLKRDQNIGRVLRQMFEMENSDPVKDLLPTLPDKSVKILNERIDKVHAQIVKCESMFGEST